MLKYGYGFLEISGGVLLLLHRHTELCSSRVAYPVLLKNPTGPSHRQKKRFKYQVGGWVGETFTTNCDSSRKMFDGYPHFQPGELEFMKWFIRQVPMVMANLGSVLADYYHSSTVSDSLNGR